MAKYVYFTKYVYFIKYVTKIRVLENSYFPHGAAQKNLLIKIPIKMKQCQTNSVDQPMPEI